MANETPPQLGQIGTRGLVVHAGPAEGGNYAYFSDNQDETWRRFQVDLPKFAEQRGLDTDAISKLGQAAVPVAVLGHQPKTTFLLNLDAIRDMDPGSQAEPSLSNQDYSAGDAFLIREDGKYFGILLTQLKDLASENAGEAKVVVRRGTVVAAIPNNKIPYGTNCILVNLTTLPSGG